MLFDAGPEGKVWEGNVKRLGMGVELGLENVERVMLSHWHRDHSGFVSFLSVLSMVIWIC